MFLFVSDMFLFENNMLPFGKEMSLFEIDMCLFGNDMFQFGNDGCLLRDGMYLLGHEISLFGNILVGKELLLGQNDILQSIRTICIYNGRLVYETYDSRCGPSARTVGAKGDCVTFVSTPFEMHGLEMKDEWPDLVPRGRACIVKTWLRCVGLASERGAGGERFGP